MKDLKRSVRLSQPVVQTIRQKNYAEDLEVILRQRLQWVAFESNGEALWTKVVGTISDHLMNDWRNGVLLGAKPEQAFFVKCDRTTMTQADIESGLLVCLVGVAPVRPAEFVIFRVEQRTADRKA